jgi:hypothetical protein
MGTALRPAFALDQNFPPFVLDVAQLLPELTIAPIFQIDSRLSDLDDRQLVIALYQLGWTGLITNNYKMLWVPAEIAAVVKTKLTIFAIEGVGHDPLRATGAVLLELPGVLRRLRPNQAQVFRVNPRSVRPITAWDYFKVAATRRRVAAGELYEQVKVTDLELETPVLGSKQRE